jgi:hypothetical protein
MTGKWEKQDPEEPSVRHSGEATLCTGPHRTVQVWVHALGVPASPIPAGMDPARTGCGWRPVVGAVDRVRLCPGLYGTVVVPTPRPPGRFRFPPDGLLHGGAGPRMR